VSTLSSSDLFEDDDDELFATPKPSNSFGKDPVNKKTPASAKPPSLFGASDDLFGDGGKNDDLFAGKYDQKTKVNNSPNQK